MRTAWERQYDVLPEWELHVSGPRDDKLPEEQFPEHFQTSSFY